MWRSTISTLAPDMYSKARTQPSSAARKRRKSASAASASGTAQKASTSRRGCGTSLSTAAVMMPSVPSAPTKRCRSA